MTYILTKSFLDIEATPHRPPGYQLDNQLSLATFLELCLCPLSPISTTKMCYQRPSREQPERHSEHVTPKVISFAWRPLESLHFHSFFVGFDSLYMSSFVSDGLLVFSKTFFLDQSGRVLQLPEDSSFQDFSEILPSVVKFGRGQGWGDTKVLPWIALSLNCIIRNFQVPFSPSWPHHQRSISQTLSGKSWCSTWGHSLEWDCTKKTDCWSQSRALLWPQSDFQWRAVPQLSGEEQPLELRALQNSHWLYQAFIPSSSCLWAAGTHFYGTHEDSEDLKSSHRLHHCPGATKPRWRLTQEFLSS